MYHDHVRRDRLTNKAWFLSVLALVLTAVGIVGGIGHSGLAAAFAPVTAALPGGESLVTVWVALGIALILTLNVHLLGRLGLRLQVAAVWLEVFSLFLVFFYSFDLSYSFILGKLSFLITQGVATTLYISAISIAIAFVLAMVGAIARLSNNGFAIAISSFYTSFFRAARRDSQPPASATAAPTRPSVTTSQGWPSVQFQKTVLEPPWCWISQPEGPATQPAQAVTGRAMAGCVRIAMSHQPRQGIEQAPDRNPSRPDSCRPAAACQSAPGCASGRRSG
jgi:hypothetical protein